MSVPAPIGLALEDKLVFKSLNLISDPIVSLLKTPRVDLNQAKDWYNKRYRLPNTKLWLLSPRSKSPICRCWPLEQSESVPN